MTTAPTLEPNTPIIRRVNISDINTTAGTQLRAAINSEIISEYAERMAGGDTFPPVILFGDKPPYLLADGFHRELAARQCALTDIMADIRPGGLADATVYAITANRSHGLRLTAADKRSIVTAALAQWPQRSDRQIAAECGVSPTTVGSVRSTVQMDSSTRIGSDGKERRMPGTVDKIGKTIPDNVLPLWQRANAESSEALLGLGNVAKRIKQNDLDGKLICRELNVKDILANFTNILRQIGLQIPYAVCACLGNNDQCEICIGRGFMSEFRYVELKKRGAIPA
jgi:hypothetical protein